MQLSTDDLISPNLLYRIMQKALALLLCGLVLIPGCTTEGDESVQISPEIEIETEACNGMVVLCHRTYDNVTFAETHNGHATHEDGIYYPASNHRTGLDAQWNAGIRAFMIDTHYSTPNADSGDAVRLCHGSDSDAYSPCYYGEVDAVDWLSNLKQLMDSAPRDVVTLLIESHVTAEHVMYVLNQSNLSDWMFTHVLGEEWPTLIELINDDTRLVVFWEQGTAENYSQIHDFVVHGWTTNYGEDSTEDMTCEVHRGDGNQPVWHMNHWVSNGLGLSDPLRSEEVNDYELLLQRAKDCWQFHENRPTFIAVDWWEDGDVVAVVEQINTMSTWNSTQ